MNLLGFTSWFWSANKFPRGIAVLPTGGCLMRLMSVRHFSCSFGALCAMGLIFGSWTNHAPAAVITYNFDVNGSSQVPSNFGVVTGSTYDWDDTTNGGFWSQNG